MDGDAVAAGTLAGLVEAATSVLAGVDASLFTRASDRQLVAAVPGLESLAARLECLLVAEVDGRGWTRRWPPGRCRG